MNYGVYRQVSRSVAIGVKQGYSSYLQQVALLLCEISVMLALRYRIIQTLESSPVTNIDIKSNI